VFFEVCVQGFRDGGAGEDEVERIFDGLWGAGADRRRMIRRRER